MLPEVRGGLGRIPFKPDHQYIVFMIDCVSSCAVTLSYAGEKPDVTGVLAVYPFTGWMQNVDAVIGRFQVPLAMLVGGADTYNNCLDCHRDKAREIEKVAKAKGKAFEMVVYENAEHAYDLTGRYYRNDYARDTWMQT